MAFRDPIAYLVIKIWIKSKLPKQSYNQRLRLIKLTLKYFGIVPLKTRHDVTKLDLTVPLLSLWCIDIDLSIQTTSLILHMAWVHSKLHRRYKSWVPCKQINCPQLVMDLGNPVEIVVHHLLIERMTCLSCQDEFSMVNNTLVYVMHTGHDL